MKQHRYKILIGILIVFLLAGCGRVSPEPTSEEGNDSEMVATPALSVVEPTASQAQTDAPVTSADAGDPASLAAPLPDTGQVNCYDLQGSAITCPAESDAYFGQDANFAGQQPAYRDNGDGTVTDLVTGLMWQGSPERDGNKIINAADKLSYSEALAAADEATLAGYDDWRLPTITELYSLIDFSGVDVSGYNGTAADGLTPFINTDYFAFGYGDTNAGERLIDAQFASSTLYGSTTMNGNQTMFGVNFADGRIKGYPIQNKTYYVLLVRGNTAYDSHAFIDNGDGTISDGATGLMWQQADSGRGLDWAEALTYCDTLADGGYADWRLPDARELQHLVDYSRSPDATQSAAIDALFSASQIQNEAGQADYAAYWTGTTHINMSSTPGANTVYVNFGESLGYMNGHWLDVHGAGAQRSDPKAGDPAAYPTGHGPQGDAIRIDNYVRCVRGGAVTTESGNQVTAVGTALAGEPAGPNPTAGGPLAAAAAVLGISEDALVAALGDPTAGPPDFAAAATDLGITEAELMAALAQSEGGRPPGGAPPQQAPTTP
ncbi:MAG: DUF1566 domain-containing protein [Anaerolineales bacterium]|nr:DUF1566 domain-containing protein [Anaerolineales bacterium]